MERVSYMLLKLIDKIDHSVIVFILLIIFSTLDSYSQDIFSRPDSLEILTYKKTKGLSTALNNEDSFFVKRRFYHGLFLVDHYYYFGRKEAYKIDTLLKLEDRWLIKKNNTWQTFFNQYDFEKRKSWKIIDGDYCYRNTPLALAKEKKKIFVFNLTYCEDLGNNLDAKVYFEIAKGIVKIVYNSGVTFELYSSTFSNEEN
ncbi:MAG: hypothetical protein ACTHMM_12205 [Agriterribacter sp.]